MEKFSLIPFADADSLAKAVAAAWLDKIAAANRARETQCVALSGGRITKEFFSNIVELAKINDVSLDAVHFFWADERCVPPNDPESNFAEAKKLLLEPLNISEKQFNRIRGEEPPDLAAKKAVEEICRTAPCNSTGQPVLDLIFLGMGEDGHVASLFPGESEAIISDSAVYRAVRNSPKPPPNRVTLGYAAIAAAKRVWVLASGAGKEDALKESLRTDGTTPLARALRLRDRTQIFSDIRI
jgi:6-phosphogluconolactonase